MIREIKFRAWDSEQEQMFHFFRMCKPKGEGTLAFECRDAWHDDWDECKWENITVMQSSGLLDKNGKEMYEGDILKCANEWSDPEDEVPLGIVEFGTGGYDSGFYKFQGFYLRMINGRQDSDGTANDMFPPHGWKFLTEVIGNIYQNQDLLKLAI